MSYHVHGLSRHPLYNTWRNMIDRCYNPSHRAYSHYGARGVRVCKRWKSSVAAFISDIGGRPSPDHSLERINGSGNYEPSNCKWATKTEQSVNRRITIMVNYRGKELCLKHAVREADVVEYYTAIYRLNMGWPLIEALETPARYNGGRNRKVREQAS
jgi:hypothetical protein